LWPLREGLAPVPKIIRWFKLSHDFLDNPDTLTLREKHGDRVILMWLRMLSWADRNEGFIKGNIEQIAKGFGRDHDPIHPTSNAKWGLICLRSMADLGWITLRSDGIQIVNYAKYNNTRGQKKLPYYTRQTIQTKKSKKTSFPTDFAVDKNIADLAFKNEWPDPITELEAFRDYHVSHGSQFKDWTAAFRMWLRNSKRFGARKSNLEIEQAAKRKQTEEMLTHGLTEDEKKRIQSRIHHIGKGIPILRSKS
jgi:hypothetical protein